MSTKVVQEVWKMKVLAMLVPVVLLVGCTAEKGDGAGPAPTQEKSGASGTEETTVYTEETTVLGLGPEPPDSTLSYGGREVKGTPGSYCWSSENLATCGDASWPIIPSKQKTLTVPPEAEMVFRYGGQDPPKTVEAGAYSLKKLQEKDATMRPDDTLKAHGSGVQRAIPTELPAGEYVLEVFIEVQQGDASYYFRVVVG